MGLAPPLTWGNHHLTNERADVLPGLPIGVRLGQGFSKTDHLSPVVFGDIRMHVRQVGRSLCKAGFYFGLLLLQFGCFAISYPLSMISSVTTRPSDATGSFRIEVMVCGVPLLPFCTRHASNRCQHSLSGCGRACDDLLDRRRAKRIERALDGTIDAARCPHGIADAAPGRAFPEPEPKAGRGTPIIGVPGYLPFVTVVCKPADSRYRGWYYHA